MTSDCNVLFLCNLSTAGQAPKESCQQGLAHDLLAWPGLLQACLQPLRAVPKAGAGLQWTLEKSRPYCNDYPAICQSTCPSLPIYIWLLHASADVQGPVRKKSTSANFQEWLFAYVSLLPGCLGGTHTKAGRPVV